MKILFSLLFLFSIINQTFTQPVWNLQNSGTTNDLNDITFNISSSFGNALYIVGDNGVILKSSNSGLSWEFVNSNTTANLYSISIRNYNEGYAAGANGTIIKTTDGGTTWVNMTSNTNKNLKEIRFFTPTKVFAVGEDGTFLRLENNIWISSQIDTVDLNSVAYDAFGQTLFAIVGNSGTVLRTTNNGVSWNKINTGISNNLNRITRTQSVVIGNNGVAFQMSGNNINFINSGTVNNLYQFGENYDLICGQNGTFLKGWNPISTITQQDLNSLVQTNYNNCFAVGNNGTIIFTNTLNVTSNAKQLNSNNISAWYYNNGNFNRHPAGGNGGFEWPKGENKYARYSSGLLIGAIVNSDTLVTVCDYGSEFYPGQTINGMPQGNGTPDFQIYKLVFDVNDSDRFKWPNSLLGNSNQGAPVYFDSTIMNWKPSDYGNQTMFYSYTDSYDSSHTNFAGMTAPLKADIKQINFSFNQPEELKNIIYQEYRIINRSNSQWTNAYINLYTDDDLGDGSTDAEGVDTNMRLAYTYKYLNNDRVYGTPPPAVGFVIIRAPLTYTGNVNDTVFYYEGKSKTIKVGYKETRLNSTVIIFEDTNQPENYKESYNVIRGLQNNGTPYVNPTTGQETKFVFSGDPVTNTGWIQNWMTDMRFYQGFGPLNMNPGDTQVIVMAQVIAKGSSNLNSITKLREASQTAIDYYNDFFEDVVIGINNITTSTPEDFQLYQNYPNPFNPTTIINYELGITNFVSLKVYDAVGKEVITLVNEKQNAGKYEVTFNGSNLSSGIYFYKIEILNTPPNPSQEGSFFQTKKMLLVK